MHEHIPLVHAGWLHVCGRCEFHTFVTAYSDCGEELPLGPGFQELVNCYWRYKTLNFCITT